MSANVNVVVLAGNLTRDPELRYTPTGMAVCSFGIAVNKRYKAADGSMKEAVTFVDVDAFKKTAELVKQYLTKGRSAMIEGELRLDQWQDKATGAPRSKLKVVAEKVHFLDSAGKGGQQAAPANEPPPPEDPPEQQAAPSAPARHAPSAKPTTTAARPAQAARPAARQPAPPPPDENLDIPDEEIPF